MATTCKLIIESAWARRTANDPDKLATGKELVRVIDRKLKQVYAKVGKVSRRFFATTSNVTPDGTKWVRPSDAIAVLWVESGGAAGTGADRKITPNGTRVYITPFSNRDAEVSPRIYPLGRNYLTEGGASNPSASANGDVLTFTYAKRHPDLAPDSATDASANTLDSTWPEHYNDILIAHVARYLAIKDGRPATELTPLDIEIKELEDLLLAEAADDNDRISKSFDTE